MQASVMSELPDKVLSKYISCEWVKKKKKTKTVKKTSHTISESQYIIIENVRMVAQWYTH